MRRVFCFFAFIILSISLTACTASAMETTDMNFCFRCKADVSFNGEQFSCSLSRTAPGRASVQILNDDLNGLSYDWDGNGFSVSYKDICAKSEKCVLPDSSFASILVQVLDYAEKNGSLTQESNGTFTGNLDDSDFTITVEKKTGNIQTLSFPQRNLSVKFYNYEKV